MKNPPVAWGRRQASIHALAVGGILRSRGCRWVCVAVSTTTQKTKQTKGEYENRAASTHWLRCSCEELKSCTSKRQLEVGRGQEISLAPFSHASPSPSARRLCSTIAGRSFHVHTEHSPLVGRFFFYLVFVWFLCFLHFDDGHRRSQNARQNVRTNAVKKKLREGRIGRLETGFPELSTRDAATLGPSPPPSSPSGTFQCLMG